MTLFLIIMIQGCAGTRDSYTSALKETDPPNTLYIKKGQKVELLAIGNGFPGWWGYYPGVESSNTAIASIECIKKRSFIPFREPGILFGGEVCYLIGHHPGETTLFFGNKNSLLTEDNYEKSIEAVITAP